MYRVTANSPSEFVNRMVPAPQGFLAPLASMVNVDAMDPATANLVKTPRKKIKRTEASRLKRKIRDQKYQQAKRSILKTESLETKLSVRLTYIIF